MKIRHGFVSNSSSSSFVVGKAQVGEEKFFKIAEALGLDKKYLKNYICMNTEYMYEEIDSEDFEQLLEELGLTRNTDYEVVYDS